MLHLAEGLQDSFTTQERSAFMQFNRDLSWTILVITDRAIAQLVFWCIKSDAN